MKCLCLILLLAGNVLAAPAQTPVPGQTNAPARMIAPPQRLVITSTNGGCEIYMKSNRAVYHGHVRVDDPEMKLTCEWLAANLPKTNNPDRYILATTNVIADLTGGTNETWHVTCDQAVYYYHLQGMVTNETITLTGHARAQSDKITAEGEPLVYDMVSQVFTGTNYTMSFNTTAFKQNLNSGGTNSARTNLPAVQTNQLSAP